MTGWGLGMRRAGSGARLSGLKGRSAIAARRPPAAPDPAASAAPWQADSTDRPRLAPTNTRRPTRSRRQHESTIRSLYGFGGLPDRLAAGWRGSRC
jgi:hypothetical protein